jgi:hypothetical protein
MRISTEMFAQDIGRALNWIGSQVGTRIDKRVKSFNIEGRRNPAIQSYYGNTYQLEYALARAWRQYRTTGTFPESEDFTIVYGFAGMTQRVYEKLSPVGQKRLRGCLEDGAKGEYGFRPLAYEMTMASRLSRSSYDLDFIDLEGKNRFDLLATKHNVAFEIECKTTSPDKGRKIHRKNLNLLSYELLPIAKHVVNSGGGHALRLIIPDRLERNKSELANLKHMVALAVRDGASLSHAGEAQYQAIKIEHWPKPDSLESSAHELLEKVFGSARNRHIIAHLSPGYGFLAIGVESQRPDIVVETLAADVKAAADQCSRDRPAVIMIQLVEITPEELSTLSQTRSGIQYAVHQIFKDDKRAHVNAITFTLPTTMEPHRLLWGNVVSGVERVFHNLAPKFPGDAVRELFRPPIS